MTFSVTLFYNTGYNAINVPGTPSLLGVGQTFDPLDINQGAVLSAVSIRATWSAVKGADYARISGDGDDFYYAIDGITMTSPDVARLALMLDPFTTIGGVAGIGEFLDGITDRHHVSKAEDTFGAFCEDDPYLIPSKPLELVSGAQFNLGTEDPLVEATVHLANMANTADGIEYVAPGSSAATVSSCVVPEVEKLGAADRTTVSIQGAGNYITPVSAYFDFSDSTVQEGIRRARSLGVESAILNCWRPPAGTTIAGGALVTGLTGQADTVNSELPFEFATVNNRRVLYGQLCQYIILSVASGNAAQFNPEDIQGDGAAPLVKYVCDPRPNGCPHFRFNYYKGETSNFWRNSIKGLPNPTAPLIYYDKSGSEIDRMTFWTDQHIKEADAEVLASQASMGYVSGVVGGAAEGYMTQTAPSISSIINTAFHATDYLHFNPDTAMLTFGAPSTDPATASTNIEADIRRRAENKANQERQQFEINRTIVIPQVNFPRSETIRDFVGNGVFVYRLRPSATDITKLDKILSMYGYKDTAPATINMLTNRSKYNYVRIHGASIKGVSGSPKWLRDAVAAQLSVGIRIWHTAPDPTAYTDGSNS